MIENIFKHYAIDAKSPTGESTGELVVFKEDALKAGAEAIETLKGLKGKKLEGYMKSHFDTAWSYVDTNQDGDVGFD